MSEDPPSSIHRSSSRPRRFLSSLLSAVVVAVSLLAVIALAACALAAASRHKKSARSPVALVGRVGTVERDLTPEGAALVCGELLPARSRTGASVARASRVRVVGARGVCLEVEPES